MQNYDTLMQYTLKLVSKKRYTQVELERKFKFKKFGTVEDRKKVISRLKELKYINDEQFAKDYVQTRLVINPKGINLLKLELKLKGVDKQVVDKVVEGAKIDELKIAIDVLERKKKAIKRVEDTYKRKQKIMRLLSSRGFKLETIYKILEKW